MERTTFVFQTVWAERLQAFPSEVRLEVYEAIIAYAKTGVQPEMSDLARGAFMFIRPDIDSMQGRFEATCNKRKEAGKRGAASRWQKSENAAESEADGGSGQLPQEEKQTMANANGVAEPMANATNATKPMAKDAMRYEYMSSMSNNIQDVELTTTPLASIASHTAPKTSSASAAMSGKPDAESELDGQKFAEFFNETMAGAGAKIAPVRKLLRGTKRLTFLNARCREYGKDAVAAVVRKAAASDFLNGSGSTGFVATFEWLFRPNNFPKVLEGNYDNRPLNPLNANGNGTLSKQQAEQQRRQGIADMLNAKMARVLSGD